MAHGPLEEMPLQAPPSLGTPELTGFCGLGISFTTCDTTALFVTIVVVVLNLCPSVKVVRRFLSFRHLIEPS